MRTGFIELTGTDALGYGEVLLVQDDGEVVTMAELKRRIRGFVMLTGCKAPDIRLSASFVRSVDNRTSDHESRTRVTLGRELINVFPAYSKPYKTKPEFVERMRIHLRIK